MADTIASVDVFQPAAHDPSRPSSAASTSRQAPAASGFTSASHSRLVRSPLTSSNSIELMPPSTAFERDNGLVKAVTVVGGSGQAKAASSNNSDGATRASVDISSGPNSRPGSNAMPISRPTIIGAMKLKRGPSVPHGHSQRITRSFSMKEERVNSERAEIEATTVEVPVATTNTVAGPSSTVAAMPPSSTTLTSKPRPPKSTGAIASKSKAPLTARPTSVSKPPPDSSNSKQMSLRVFFKGKPLTVGSATTTDTSSSIALEETLDVTTRKYQTIPFLAWFHQHRRRNGDISRGFWTIAHNPFSCTG
ncbi:hypothetical protein OG21DRAFT_208523 [Imleria badia]|nr:hypothetical protein OG21DRAFT_208523 [Imleria badia]